MALAANALTLVATAEGDLSIASGGATALLERYINTASMAIEAYCQRLFQKATRTERVAHSRARRLVLRNTPLVSITSITNDGTAVDTGDYEIEDEAAGLVLGDSIWVPKDHVVADSLAQDVVPGTGERLLTIVYVGGYVLPNDAGTRNLPYDIEEACLLTVASLYRARGADRRIMSEHVGDFSAGFGGVNTAIGRGRGGIIPDEAFAALRPYRRAPL